MLAYIEQGGVEKQQSGPPHSSHNTGNRVWHRSCTLIVNMS